MLSSLAALRCVAAGEVLYIPALDDVVLQTVPSIGDPRIRTLEALRRQLAEAPRGQQRAVALSEGYLDFGRDTGDARYLGRAGRFSSPG